MFLLPRYYVTYVKGNLNPPWGDVAICMLIESDKAFFLEWGKYGLFEVKRFHLEL